MALNTVKQKLQLKHPQHYRSPAEFVADVRLVFSNCAKYNEVSGMRPRWCRRAMGHLSLSLSLSLNTFRLQINLTHMHSVACTHRHTHTSAHKHTYKCTHTNIYSIHKHFSAFISQRVRYFNVNSFMFLKIQINIATPTGRKINILAVPVRSLWL